LLAQEKIAKKLYGKIKNRMEKLRVGDSLDKANDIGAIVSSSQLETIQRLVSKGVEEGGALWQPSWVCPVDGYYYPPSLFTKASPSSTISQEEIFGPVLVAMTFRTHQEAIKLANNTRYGLAASIWTENINLALDLAPKIKAGTVWINCTNTFDAASGFGGYRESGFGREGGKEGLFEYIKPKLDEKLSKRTIDYQSHGKSNNKPSADIDRTAKLYIGGKQTRPDGGYSLSVTGPGGHVGEVGEGNRKDIRNAVEAAHAQTKWKSMTGHARAQVLYYLAENLDTRKLEFAQRINSMRGVRIRDAQQEVSLAIQRIYYYAAMADKYDGRVHPTIQRNVTLAMPEPIGVMGIVCPDEFPLLGLISTVMPAVAMGNTTVVIPSEKAPLSATDLYQVLDTSDVPGGTINIVTGIKETLVPVLAEHLDVDGLWYFGDQQGSKQVEFAAADNMKRTWVSHGKYRDWRKPDQGAGEEFLRKSTQIKNIWIPYGA
jgi:aldehyde dehydrogenase (NAD+)